MNDRFGLGWRDELAAAIFSRLDAIDVVEVLADDLLDARPAVLRAMRTLGVQVPLLLHGTGLGLATTETVDQRRLDRIARVVGAVEPEAWSEHFAFVRGGGVEIGHLAAPSRTAATVHGAARNVERAARVVGSRPVMENVATLVDPPGSDRDEATWLAQCLDSADCGMLLDLHNLHANATNFGFDPVAFLDRLPLGRLRQIHLAGGRWIGMPGARRLLDDHLHDVPDPVFDLLSEVAARASQPLTVILERDGKFPGVEALVSQLDRARAAVARGRLAARKPPEVATPSAGRPGPGLEGTLARVYVDAAERARWLRDAKNVDRIGLEMAAQSYERKRKSRNSVLSAQCSVLSAQ